ncbi:MAG TPA: ABC transporter ATP-binding protein [Solirubrobacteraceae bacterium]|nr:ABC transporter ATP-binding protein [Solirubrobacteraceae bacterium]
MAALLEVGELRVRFAGGVDALRGVSFSLERGESLAIVGESGTGKSTLGHCIVGLIGPPQASGSVRVLGREVLGADPPALAELRWETVSIALQGAPLNPTATIGAQLAEPLRERRRMDRREARRRAAELAVGLGLAPELLERHPHELSGGERRRVALAMTLALDPELVVLDEPTAGRDPLARRELLERIAGLAAARGFGLVVLTHDLPAAARLSPRCLVLYAGEAIEAGNTRDVIDRPAHPYTAGLVRAYPVMSTTKDLRPIRGAPPDPRALPGGCAFWPRCSQAEPVCREQRPVLQPVRGRLVACHPGGLRRVLSAVGLCKSFGRTGRATSALRGVSLDVVHGEAVGVVGPTASGKTTLARILAGQLDADAGEVRLDPDRAPARDAARTLRARVQLVMQDPWEALSPRLRVEELVREPLDIRGGLDGRRRRAAVAEVLEAVALPRSGPFLDARVHELSGGQLQRIALARALIADPEVLVADEPTSMLDASEQARLLVVLRERQTQMGLALVLISHDLALVRKATDRIVVLDAGRVVEHGSSQRVGTSPSSDTARALVASAPSFEVGER